MAKTGENIIRTPARPACAPQTEPGIKMARSALLHVMVQAAMKAGRSLSRDFGEVQNLQVSMKGPADFVSQADRKAEDIVFSELSRARATPS